MLYTIMIIKTKAGVTTTITIDYYIILAWYTLITTRYYISILLSHQS